MNHPVFQLVFYLVFFYDVTICMYACVRACMCVRVDRRFTSHRGLHFPANRFNFTFSIELEFSLALAHSHSLSLSLSTSYNSRLFVFAVCPAVCLDCIFMATAQIHRHQTLKANQLRGAHTAIYLYLFYLFSFTLQL